MMIRRGDKKRFREFVKAVKQDPHRYFYIKSNLIKMKENQIDINTQYYNGKTLLHLALQLKNIKLFNLFLKAGVNPNLANESGETPLHRAIIENQIEFVKSLVNAGCDINIGGEQEQSPLHYAVINGNLDIIKYLMDHGAELMLLDENNNLPIDYAIDESDLKIIRYFLTKQNIDDVRQNKIKELTSKAGEQNV
jgi:ankyrin repeat protein